MALRYAIRANLKHRLPKLEPNFFNDQIALLWDAVRELQQLEDDRALREAAKETTQ